MCVQERVCAIESVRKRALKRDSRASGRDTPSTSKAPCKKAKYAGRDARGRDWLEELARRDGR